jgi:hypothetical protein
VVNKFDQSTKVEFGETTLLSDQFSTFLPANTDPGEPTFVLAYDPADSQYQLLTGFLAAGTACAFQIQFLNAGDGNTSTEQFQAYVGGLGREFEKKSLLQCPITLRGTGDPGYAGD